MAYNVENFTALKSAANAYNTIFPRSNYKAGIAQSKRAKVQPLTALLSTSLPSWG